MFRARRVAYLLSCCALLLSAPAMGAIVEPPAVAGIPIDFILFALTLAGIALFHQFTLPIALVGLGALSLFKIMFSPFAEGAGIGRWIDHFGHEWVLLANLLGLLLGFALLSKHFEASRVPDWLPKFLPDDWKGGLVLLVMIFVLSSFLDNIAAALIGGTIAGAVFRGKVHTGYLVAIVAASNAGGSGSVVGDTTTTMMWIDGVNPLQVLEAYVAAGTAMLVCGVPAAIQQQRYSPIRRDPPAGVVVDWTRVFIVVVILVTAIVVNVVINVRFNEISGSFPFIGAAVWVALLICVPLRKPAWSELPNATRGSIFLLSLVLAASMMPVHKLPDASWRVALGLGFVSAVFDNIPADGARLAPRRIRLGIPGLRGRLRRLDDLVRLIRWRRAVEHVSRGEERHRVGARRLARHRCLRYWLFCDARGAGLVSATQARICASAPKTAVAHPTR